MLVWYLGVLYDLPKVNVKHNGGGMNPRVTRSDYEMALQMTPSRVHVNPTKTGTEVFA